MLKRSILIILHGYTIMSKMNLGLKGFWGLCTVLLGMYSANAQPVVTLESDTVCVYQDVFVNSSINTASSYYWGTCSAWLERDPVGRVVANTTAGLDGPTPIELVNENGRWFLFTVNYNANYELLRFDLGSNLGSTPLPQNLGNFANGIPQRTTGLSFIQEGGNWYGFAIGGVGINTGLTRIEFGNSLSNTPNVINMGNLAGLLTSPQDVTIFKEGANFYGYYCNGLSGNLMRLDFGSAITNVPSVVDLGNPGGFLAFPTAITLVKQGNSHHGFVVNRLSNTLTRLDFGASLLNIPAVTDMGNVGGFLNNPRDINFAYDDNLWYGYITNEATNTLVMLKFGASITNIPASVTESTNFASFNGPRGITKLVRQKDNVYGFVTNWQTSTISQIHYDSSTHATTLKAFTEQPGVYQYTKAGLYNIYYEITNPDGTTYSEQHRIEVLNIPPLTLQNDTTICQGDTLFMVANASRLKNILWDPVYNLLYQTDTTSVYVYPEEDYTYNVYFEMEYGCKFDTMINVTVSKIKADAGEDRLIADGAITELGGPRMSKGHDMHYNWFPATYLDDNRIETPRSRPTDSLIYYYLEVRNDFGCVKKDTVAVRTFCGNLEAPNVFDPLATVPSNRTFGLENYQLSKLDYFRVFNRYGEMVFETTDPRKRWDGFYKNVPQPLGSYVWVAKGQCNNGRNVERTGNVLLVR
ncbi:MAG: hypothetical protein RL660_2884 [Bacteroidota bacterium]